MKVNGDLDLDGDILIGGQAKSLKVEHVSTLPAIVLNDESRLLYNQTDKQIYFNNGTQYKNITQSPLLNFLHIDSVDPGVDGVIINSLYDPLISTRLIGIVSNSLILSIDFTVSSKTLNVVPVITCNGTNATLVISTYDNVSGYVWSGHVNVVLLSTNTQLRFVHSEGNVFDYSFQYVTRPLITFCVINGYPIGQTEVKENDIVQLTIVSDKLITVVDGFSGQANKPFSTTILVPATTVTVDVVIDNRGNVSTPYPIYFRIDSTDSSRSNKVNTSVFGNVDGENVLTLNNTQPSVTIDSITYPIDQTSISSAQTATVNNTVTNASSVVYFSNNSQLTIANTTTYETAKTVTYASGDFNTTTNNFRITATRTENGATAISNTVVHINNELPTCTLSLTATRLRSGGTYDSSPQQYVVTIITSQNNIVNITSGTSSGTFLETSWTKVGSYTWTRTLIIADSSIKGIHNLTDFIATTSGGLEQSNLIDNSFEVGGFVLRTMTISALSAECDIGTVVTDVTLLRCTNLLLGNSGDNNVSYANNFADITNTFSITTPSNTLNASGHLWHNNDSIGVANNYSGNLQIEIEEIEEIEES